MFIGPCNKLTEVVVRANRLLWPAREDAWEGSSIEEHIRGLFPADRDWPAAKKWLDTPPQEAAMEALCLWDEADSASASSR